VVKTIYRGGVTAKKSFWSEKKGGGVKRRLHAVATTPLTNPENTGVGEEGGNQIKPNEGG